MLTLLIVSCSSDKPAAPVAGNLPYVELTAKAHIFYYLGMPDGSVRDSIIARVDSVYASGGTSTPLTGLHIDCDGNALAWNAADENYVHEPQQFIEYDTYQVFSIDATGNLPALTDSVLTPERMLIIGQPFRGAQINRNVPLAITWNGAGPGEVVIELKGANYQVVTSLITADDGGELVLVADLSQLAAGTGYIYLYKVNMKTITAPGYDPRSWIKGVVGFEIKVTFI
jgi:hypothetical protein